MKKIIIIKATQTPSHQEFKVLDKFFEYSLYKTSKEHTGWVLYNRIRGEKIVVESGILSISEVHKLAIVHANR